MIVSLIRTVYFLRLEAENTAVTDPGFQTQIIFFTSLQATHFYHLIWYHDDSNRATLE